MFGESSDDEVTIEGGSEDKTMEGARHGKLASSINLQFGSRSTVGMGGRDIRFNKGLIF